MVCTKVSYISFDDSASCSITIMSGIKSCGSQHRTCLPACLPLKISCEVQTKEVALALVVVVVVAAACDWASVSTFTGGAYLFEVRGGGLKHEGTWAGFKWMVAA